MFWAHVSSGKPDLSGRCFAGEEEGCGRVKRRHPSGASHYKLCIVQPICLSGQVYSSGRFWKALEASGKFQTIVGDQALQGPQDPALSRPRCPPPTQQPPLLLAGVVQQRPGPVSRF